MMIIVVYVFYRQQTLRTSEMSLIFNKFQFIYVYLNDASILSRSLSHLLVDHMKVVYMSLSILYRFFFFSSSSSCEKRRIEEEVMSDHLNDE
jgi:hypothetical protein